MQSIGTGWRRAKEVNSSHSATTVATTPCPFLLLRGFCTDYDIEKKHRHRLVQKKEDEIRKEAMNTLSKGLEVDIVDIRKEIAEAEKANMAADAEDAANIINGTSTTTSKKPTTTTTTASAEGGVDAGEESLYTQFVSLVEELKRERKEYKDWNVEAALSAFFEKSKLKRCRHGHSAEYLRVGKEMSPYALLEQFNNNKSKDAENDNNNKKSSALNDVPEFFQGILDIAHQEKSQKKNSMGVSHVVTAAGWTKAALEILMYNGTTIRPDNTAAKPFALTVFESALDSGAKEEEALAVATTSSKKNKSSVTKKAVARRVQLKVPNVIVQQSAETTSISKPKKDPEEQDHDEELRQLYRDAAVDIPSLVTLANTCLVSTRVVNVIFPVTKAGAIPEPRAGIRGVPDASAYSAGLSGSVVAPVRVTHHIVDVHLQLGHLPALVDYVGKSQRVGAAISKAFTQNAAKEASNATTASGGTTAPKQQHLRVPTMENQSGTSYTNQVNLADPYFVNMLTQVIEKVAVARYKYELQPSIQYPVEETTSLKSTAEKHIYTVRYRSLGIQNCGVVDPEPLLTILQKRFRDEDAAYAKGNYKAYFGAFNADAPLATFGPLRNAGGYQLAVASTTVTPTPAMHALLPHPSLIAAPATHNALHALDVSNNKLDSLRFLFFLRLHFLPRVTLGGGSGGDSKSAGKAANIDVLGASSSDHKQQHGGGSLAYLWLNPNPITLRPDYRTHVLNTLHKGMGSAALHQVASITGEASSDTSRQQEEQYRLLPLVALDGEPIERKRLTLPFPVAAGGSSWNERGYMSQEAISGFKGEAAATPDTDISEVPATTTTKSASKKKGSATPAAAPTPSSVALVPSPSVPASEAFASTNDYDRSLRSFILFGKKTTDEEDAAEKLRKKQLAAEAGDEEEEEEDDDPETVAERLRVEQGWKNYYSRHPTVKKQIDSVQSSIHDMIAKVGKPAAEIRPEDLLHPSNERAPLTAATLSESECAAALNFLRLYCGCWESGRVPMDVDADLCTWGGYSMATNANNFDASGNAKKPLLRMASNSRVQNLIDRAGSCQDVNAQMTVAVAKIIASGLGTLRCKTVSRQQKLAKKREAHAAAALAVTKLRGKLGGGSTAPQDEDEEEEDDDDDYNVDTWNIGGLGAVSGELFEDKEFQSLVQGLTVIKYKQRGLDENGDADVDAKELAKQKEICRKEAETALRTIMLLPFSDASDVDQPMADPALGTTSARGGFNVTPTHASAMLTSAGVGHTTINAFLNKFPLHHLSAGISSVPVTSNTPAISRFMHPNCSLTLNALSGCSWYDSLSIRDTTVQEEALMAGRDNGMSGAVAQQQTIASSEENSKDGGGLLGPIPYLPTVPFNALPKTHTEATLFNIGQLLQEESVLHRQRMIARRDAIRASKALIEERAQRRAQHLRALGKPVVEEEESSDEIVEVEDEEEIPEENHGNLNNTDYNSEFYAEYAATKDSADPIAATAALTRKESRKSGVNGSVAALQRRAAENSGGVTEESVMLAVLQQLTQHTSTAIVGAGGDSSSPSSSTGGSLAYAMYARVLPPFLHYHLFWYLSSVDIRQLRLLHAAIVTTYSRNLLQLTPAFMLGNTAAEVASMIKFDRRNQPKLTNAFDKKSAKKRMRKEDAAKKMIEDAAYYKGQRKLAKKNRNKGLRAPHSYEEGNPREQDGYEEDSDSSGYEVVGSKKKKKGGGDGEGSDAESEVSSSVSSASARSLDEETKIMIDNRREMLDKIGQRANWEENLNSSVAKNENIVSHRFFRGGRDCCEAFRGTIYPAGMEVAHFFAASDSGCGGGSGIGNAFHPSNQQGSISIHAVPDFCPTQKLTGIEPAAAAAAATVAAGGTAVVSKRQQQIDEMKAKIAAAKAAKESKKASKASRKEAESAKAGMVKTATGGGGAFFGQGVSEARPTYFAVTMHGSMSWTPPSSKSGQYDYRCKTTSQSTTTTSTVTSDEATKTTSTSTTTTTESTTTTVNASVSLATPAKSIFSHVDRTMTLVQTPPTVALSPYYTTTTTQPIQLKRKLPIQYLQEFVADRSVTMCGVLKGLRGKKGAAVAAEPSESTSTTDDVDSLLVEDPKSRESLLAWYAQEHDVAVLPPLVRAVVLRKLDQILMGFAESGIVDFRAPECEDENVSDLVALVDHFLAQRGVNESTSASKATTQERNWSRLGVVQAAVRAFKSEQQRRERITSVREALDEEDDALETARQDRIDRLRAKRFTRLAAEALATPEPVQQGRWPKKKKAPHPLAADFDEEEEARLEQLELEEMPDAAPRAGERRYQLNDRLFKAKHAKLPTSAEVAQKALEDKQIAMQAQAESDAIKLGRKRWRQGGMGPSRGGHDADATSNPGCRRVEHDAPPAGSAADVRRRLSPAHSLIRQYNTTQSPPVFYLRRFQIVNDAVTIRPAPSVAPSAGVVAATIQRPSEENGNRAKVAFKSSNNRMFNSLKAAQEVMSNSHAMQLYNRSNANANGGSLYCHLSSAVVSRLMKEYTFLSAHHSGLGAVSDDMVEGAGFSGALYFPPPAKTIQQRMEDAQEEEEKLARRIAISKASGNRGDGGGGGDVDKANTMQLTHEEQSRVITRGLERAVSEKELHDALHRDILGKTQN